MKKFYKKALKYRFSPGKTVQFFPYHHNPYTTWNALTRIAALFSSEDRQHLRGIRDGTNFAACMVTERSAAAPFHVAAARLTVGIYL